jgi:hypothetical protein
MNSQVDDFVRNLTSASPELADVYRLHIADQGELLPHVLMGEITRLVIANSSREQPEWLPSLFRQVEAGLESGNGSIAELVGVSFVENLSGEEVAIRALMPLMGQLLRREVRSICGV